MTLPVIFHADADAECGEAIAWYESRQPGFFRKCPSSFPAVDFFVGILPFPLFPDSSKTAVLCQGYFSALLVSALPS